eukprot:TRINITY_DN19067_c0_g1_i1.p1 TRINITY_DN19067_c0_g1~~TRINITY_DN19067_c0_g1_i1.p1  ORF type:complete len:500 (+),score=78.74 TRINITY_DN19067_c0_g1_i1:54-1502(+)
MAPLSLEAEMALLPPQAGNTCGELPAGPCQREDIKSFLELCCELCYDSACAMSQELVALAQGVWDSLVSAAVAAVCEPALLAAGVVLLQLTTNFIGSDEDGGFGLPFLKRYLDNELEWSSTEGAGDLPELRPFPFAAEFLVLYQHFIPSLVSGNCGVPHKKMEVMRVGCSRADGFTTSPLRSTCQAEPPLRRRNILMPRRASLSKASCPVVADDDFLALRCRARRHDSLVLSAPSRGIRRPRDVPKWQCPAGARGSVNSKYARETVRNCASAYGTWGKRIESQLKCVAVQAAEALQLRPGDTVLDWGSGCGWALTWMSALYGTKGYGIEGTSQNIAWSRRFSEGDFCLYDGFDLGWVPDRSFDAVISYWVLYHHNTTQQCRVVRQLVRKLRPGGRAWLGGNIPSNSLNIYAEPFRRRDWLRCLLSPALVGGVPVALDFIPDAQLFSSSWGMIVDDPGGYLYYSPTYSVLIRRLLQDEDDLPG